VKRSTPSLTIRPSFWSKWKENILALGRSHRDGGHLNKFALKYYEKDLKDIPTDDPEELARDTFDFVKSGATGHEKVVRVRHVQLALYRDGMSKSKIYKLFNGIGFDRKIETPIDPR
jgi:hypothetical protein